MQPFLKSEQEISVAHQIEALWFGENSKVSLPNKAEQTTGHEIEARNRSRKIDQMVDSQIGDQEGAVREVSDLANADGDGAAAATAAAAAAALRQGGGEAAPRGITTPMRRRGRGGEIAWRCTTGLGQSQT